MRKLTVVLLGMLIFSSAALAQMGGGGMGGGGMGGGGMGGGGMGGGGMGGHGAPEVENDATPTNNIGANDHPHEIKPISRELFDKVVTGMFNQADVNRDGMVTLAELQSLIDARRAVIIRERFKAIDANHDGTIDLAEFTNWQGRMGSAAASDYSAYAGHLELVAESIGPTLGSSERDEALASIVEPLSPAMITKANVHYRAGVTLDDVLTYENARFDGADTNHDGFLVQPELATLRHKADKRPGVGGPAGKPSNRSQHDEPAEN